MKTYVCCECGKEYQAMRPSRTGACIDCGMKHVEEAASQLRAHKGPYYDRWKEGIRLFIEE